MSDTPEVPEAAVKLVESFEGFSPSPYLCPAHVWTIGFGSTRDLDGNPVTKDTPQVSQDEAGRLVARDLGASARCVDSAVHVPLTGSQKAALCDLIYNIGIGNFETSTLLRVLNAGDYKAAAQQFDVWNRGGGRVLRGLVIRRAAERRLFESA